MQRDTRTHIRLLCFKSTDMAEFSVMYTRHAMLGEREECVCVQPVAGSNLWMDRRLVLYTDTCTNKSNTNESNNNNNKSTEQNEGCTMRINCNEKEGKTDSDTPSEREQR